MDIVQNPGKAGIEHVRKFNESMEDTMKGDTERKTEECGCYDGTGVIEEEACLTCNGRGKHVYEAKGHPRTTKKCDMEDQLSFDDWLEQEEDNLNCEAAETGADRELDFDEDAWHELKYEQYLVKTAKKCDIEGVLAGPVCPQCEIPTQLHEGAETCPVHGKVLIDAR